MEPEVEVLLAERVSATKVRLFIDHPGGVTLELCERVTRHLRDLLVEYGLEVSSPGPERPLTKPEHFHRFVGRRIRLRTGGTDGARESFTGELVGASDDGVTVSGDAGVVAIPFADINKGNLLAG